MPSETSFAPIRNTKPPAEDLRRCPNPTHHAFRLEFVFLQKPCSGRLPRNLPHFPLCLPTTEREIGFGLTSLRPVPLAYITECNHFFGINLFHLEDLGASSFQFLQPERVPFPILNFLRGFRPL